MSSDEEYLDDLLKSMVEDEERADDTNIEGNLLEEADGESLSMDDLGLAIEDTDDMTAVESGFPAIDDLLNENSEESEITQEVLDSDDSIMNDFAIEDTGAEEEASVDFAIEDMGAEEEAPVDFAIEDMGAEEEAPVDFAIEDIGAEEEAPVDFAIEDIGAEEEAPVDFAIEDIGAEEEVYTEDIPSEEEIDDFAIEDFGVVEPEADGQGINEASISDDEVDAMFAAADAAAMEEETAIEINTEEDMLALLDSMSNEIEAENAAAEQAAAMAEENTLSGEEEESETGKKKKKKLFGGKKKEEKELAGEEGDNQEETDKKPNFFTKFIAFLTESDDEDEDELKEGLEPSDENKSILEELDKEDKKKKKKKGKKGKGESEGEEGEESGKKKEKKKKEKKEKKEKKAAADTLETEPEKLSKRISKKSIAVIAGLGLTLTAMIIVFCSIVPMFFDKKAARDAYYQADYKKSYELLYNKKLDSSDTIIYNQSKIIVEMSRKLEAYHNYLAIGDEVRALDALMIGVQKYPDLMLEAEEYHVTQEVDAIYETMLNILNDKYEIPEHLAKVIIDYDDLTYTRKLESVVNGTPFENPNAIDWNGSDVLSEEQDFYEDTAPDNVLENQTETTENNGENEPADTALLDGTTDSSENPPADTAEENPVLESTEAEQTAGTDTNAEVTYIPEEPVSTDTAVPEDNAGSAGETETPSGGQGKMIQGVRQPIDVQIHGN